MGVVIIYVINVIINILFDGENISFDANLVMYINRTNMPPIMIINKMYENQNLLYIVPLIRPTNVAVKDRLVYRETEILTLRLPD